MLITGCTTVHRNQKLRMKSITIKTEPPKPTAADGWHFTGSFTLNALRYALSRNGYSLAYPQDKGHLPIALWGTYTPQQLAHALDRQTNCHAVLRGNTIHCRYNKTHTFTDLVPNFTALTTTTLDGITVTNLGRQDILKGPDSALPLLAKLLKTAYRKPPQIRITAYLIDANAAANLDFQLAPKSTAIQFDNLSTIYSGITATINALESWAAIKTEFSTLAQTGKPITFADTDQREVQEYATLPNAQQTGSQSSLTSGLTQRTAGMTITLTATAAGRYWTVTGNIEDSNFNGTSALADLLTRSETFTASMAPGELFRITQFEQRNNDHEIGIPQNTAQYNNDHTTAHWSLWLRIQPLYLKRTAQ